MIGKRHWIDSQKVQWLHKLLILGVTVWLAASPYSYGRDGGPAPMRTGGSLCRPETIKVSGVMAEVIGISDGDTLKVRFPPEFYPYPGQQSVRLLEIDAPESGQAFGNRAKQALSDLAYRKVLHFEIHGHDRYCRPLALVGTPTGAINLEMVRVGMAWSNREYGRDPAYPRAEAAAREARLGLWADSNPTYPGDYRREKRSISVKREQQYDR